MAITLVGGGARSGKSTFGRRYIEEHFEGGIFLATAEARDEEMRDRIAHHQAERGDFWTTLEEPLDLTGALQRHAGEGKPFLVDCLTLWLSNVLFDEALDEEAEIERLGTFLRSWNGPTVVLISNEVGLGIAPDNPLSRRYRDLAGRLNQTVAEAADEVYWTVFGIPTKLKPGGGL